VSEVSSEDGEVDGLTVSDFESSNDEGGHGSGEFSGDGGVDLGSEGGEEEREEVSVGKSPSTTRLSSESRSRYAMVRSHDEKKKGNSTHGHSNEIGKFSSTGRERKEGEIGRSASSPK